MTCASLAYKKGSNFIRIGGFSSYLKMLEYESHKDVSITKKKVTWHWNSRNLNGLLDTVKIEKIVLAQYNSYLASRVRNSHLETPWHNGEKKSFVGKK